MLPTTLTIANGTSLTEDVTELAKYTEYEFQVLAFTSVGDGPKSSIYVDRTKEDGKGLVVDDDVSVFCSCCFSLAISILNNNY